MIDILIVGGLGVAILSICVGAAVNMIMAGRKLK